MIKKILNFFVGPRVAPKSEAQRVAEFVGEFLGDRSDTPRRVKPTRERYVCGFAFYGDRAEESKVVLIQKNKPEWQAGLLNGVGGKIEPGETPEQAMAREFKEEAGIDSLPIDWAVFARCEFRGAQVIFLRAFDDGFYFATTKTAEVIIHRSVRGIDATPENKIIPNLRWLIPLAWHFEPTREVVTIGYDGRN